MFRGLISIPYLLRRLRRSGFVLVLVLRMRWFRVVSLVRLRRRVICAAVLYLAFDYLRAPCNDRASKLTILVE